MRRKILNLLFLHAALLAALLAGAAPLRAQTAQLTNSEGYDGDPTAIWVPELQMYLGARTDGSGTGGTNGPTLFESSRLESLFSTAARYQIPNSSGGFEAGALLEWTNPVTNKNALYLDYRDPNNVHQVLMNPNVADPFCQQTANCWTNMTLIKAADAVPGRDWSYLVHGGLLYCIYEDSGAGQGGVFAQLMIDPMNANTTRPAVQISEAIAPNGSGNNKLEARIWEFRNNAMGGTNEAPIGFTHVDANGNLLTFITYSANSYQYGDYDMGLLTFTGGPSAPLDVAASWTKSQDPIMQASNYSTTVGAVEWVCATGSNVVVPSPDGTELWQLYNGKFNCSTIANPNYVAPAAASDEPTILQAVNGRTIRLQLIPFDPGAQTASDPTGGAPIFGSPWADGELHNQPSGEPYGLPANFLTPTAGATSQTFDDSTGRLQPTGTAGSGTQGTDDQLTAPIYYSDKWATTTGNPNAAGDGNYTGTLTTSNNSGSYFVVAFSGSRIQLVGPVGKYTNAAGTSTKQGAVNIYVDGNFSSPTAVNLGTSSSTTFYDSGTLSAGQHTVTVVLSNNSPVQLDSVVVYANPASSSYLPTSTTASVPSGTYTIASGIPVSATVSPSASGTVSFYDSSNLLGTASASNGYASFSVPNLAAGSHILKAVFAGTTTYAASSGTTPLTVAPITPVITLSSTASNYNGTLSVPLTATIPGTGTMVVPQAAVTLYDGTTSVGTSAFAYNASAGGFVATLTATAASAGTHSYKAVLTADVNYNQATSNTLSILFDTNNVWVANGNGSVSAVSETGAAVTGSAVAGGGVAVAIDNAGDVWSLNQPANKVAEYSSTGALLSAGSTVGGLNAPAALAFDGAGLLWVANGNGTLSVLSAPASAASPVAYQVSSSSPTSISIDPAGNVWITNAGDNSVTQVVGAASPVVTPTAAAVTSNSLASKP